MLYLSGFELCSRWVPLKDVLVCKKMVPFAMNASNIERFAALTRQRQKDLFEVNKNLTEPNGFGIYGDWKKKQDKRVLFARDGMLYKEFYKVQKRTRFCRGKEIYTTQYFIAIILFTSKSISLYTRNNNND